MASKLAEMLAPDETVLFRAYWNWREIVVRILGYVTFSLIVLFGFESIMGDEDWERDALITVLVIATLLIRQMRRAEVMVTDRRLLHKTGHKRPPLVEIATADIEAIDLMPGLLGFGGYLSIKARGKVQIRVTSVPGLRQLWRVLAQKTGLPGPPALGIKMNVVYHGSALFCILAGLGFVAGTGRFLIDRMVEGEAATAMDFILVFVVFVPAIVMALLVGMVLALIISFLLIRIFLSAAQAQQLAHMGHDSHQTGFMGWCSMWQTRISLRFLGWLYGQRLHSRDKE